MLRISSFIGLAALAAASVLHELTSPAARAELLDASWKLALVVGCALGAEWLTLRAVRSRARQSSTGVSAPYRVAISAGSGSS